MKSLEKVPEGTLRTAMWHGRVPQFYWCRSDWREQYPRGKYIQKSERSIAVKLSQKEYDEHVLKVVQKEIDSIERFMKNYQPEHKREVFKNLPIAKQQLLTPYWLSEEEYVEKWLNTTKPIKNTYEFKEEHYTDRGECVRSKSEQMIANKLYYLGIPYKYEEALFFADGSFIFPDFTVLNKRTLDVYYLEHFGRMDDPEYCKETMIKLESYSQNGYQQGKNLLYTMESKQRPFDMRIFDKLIKEYFI